MLLHQTANSADHKQKPKEKNQYVCHDLKATKITNLFAQSKFRTLQSIVYPIEKERLLEHAAFWRDVNSRVLPTTPFLVKTIQTRAGRAILTVTSRTCAVHETTPLSTSERRT